MDEQDQAQQALKTMFRRDQAEQPARKARATREANRRPGPVTTRWLIGIAVMVLILAPTAFIVIYPRFGPVDTMTAFCQDESIGQYSRAYALLSSRAQHAVSLAAFSQASDSVNLATCGVDGGIPFIFGGTQSSLSVTYLAGDAGGGTAGSMSFVRENGQWRVDAMTPDLFHLTP